LPVVTYMPVSDSGFGSDTTTFPSGSRKDVSLRQACVTLGSLPC